MILLMEENNWYVVRWPDDRSYTAVNKEGFKELGHLQPYKIVKAKISKEEAKKIELEHNKKLLEQMV